MGRVAMDVAALAWWWLRVVTSSLNLEQWNGWETERRRKNEQVRGRREEAREE